MLPMKSAMSPLLNAVRTRDNSLALEWKQQEVWTTLETLITASSVQSGYVFVLECLEIFENMKNLIDSVAVNFSYNSSSSSNQILLYSGAVDNIQAKLVKLAHVPKLGLAIIAPLSMVEI